MPTNVNARVATALRVELARRDQPAASLAEILGCSRQAISQKMRGDYGFRIEELDRIATAWGVPLASLLNEYSQASAA